MSQIRSRNKKFQKRTFEQLAEAMTENNNVISSIDEVVHVNDDDDQVNMDEDDGYGQDEGCGDGEADGDCGGAHDEGDDQQTQAPAVVVAPPATRPHRSITKRT